jgi:hypothetical protein
VNHKAICIKVERDSGNHIGIAHVSETALDEYTQWDFVINNTGSLEQLHLQIKEMCKQLSI